MQIPFELRNADERDENFILSSWLKGLRQKRSQEFINPANNKPVLIDQANSLAFMPHDLFFERLRPIVENKIYKESTITVAHNPDIDDQIYGFIAYRQIGSTTILSFCYVKQPFRKMGLARELYKTAKGHTNVATYHAPWLTKIYKKEGIYYDPFFDLKE